MKRTIFSFTLALLCLYTYAQYVPSAEVKQTQEQFQNDKFGVFIHWGIYSMLGDGEWVMNNKSLNYLEYPHLADGFCPSLFDAEAWVKAIKSAGARYITITSRHHDGFSMFKTAEDKFNIVDGTPFRRDVLKELSDACQRHGLRLHFYYSHLDWHRLDYPLGRTGRKLGRPTDQQDWSSYYQFMNNQLRELLTHYGPIGCIWFDGWWDHDQDATPFNWQLDEQYRLIHSLQPQCMVANNHHRIPFDGEDVQIFEQDLPGDNQWGYKEFALSNLPLESCITMNNTWGYSITDKHYKSAEELIRTLVRTAGRNGNLLLNIGPRPDGQLPQEAIERLEAMGQWLNQYGPTIYNTRGGSIAPHPWGVTTQRGNTLYVHILQLADTALFLPLGQQKVKSARLFATGKAVKVQRTDGGAVLLLPEKPTDVDTVVELQLG